MKHREATVEDAREALKANAGLGWEFSGEAAYCRLINDIAAERDAAQAEAGALRERLEKVAAWLAAEDIDAWTTAEAVVAYSKAGRMIREVLAEVKP